MKKILLLTTFLIAFFPKMYSQTMTSVAYTEDTSVILNPERGFYHHTQTHGGTIDETNTTPYQVLTSSELDSYKAGGTSLVLRLFYLHEFYNSTSVSATYLANMQADFDLLRSKGMKAVIRFAYSNNEAKKDLGVTVARIQGHLTSLKAIIEANQDVIMTAQLGLIGTYGESYYTSNFGDGGAVSDAQWTMRSQVVQSFLDILPAGIQLQLRTPLQKTKYLGFIGQSGNAVTEQEAYNPSIAKSRLGHFNDCILSSPDQKIQEFKILKSSFTSLAPNIRIGYRALKDGQLVFGSSQCQMPDPTNSLALYTIGSVAVTGGVPNWTNITNVVAFTNGTILELKVADDATYLYFRVKESGYLQISRDTYQLFVDTDNNSATGWIDNSAWTSTGADYVIENDILKEHTLSGNGYTFNTVLTVTPIVSLSGSFDDQGTFATPSDIDYVADESNYVITGGETCAPTTQTECATSLARMELHHYSFLNEIYHPTVLNGWMTNNCYTDFQKKLGYRIRLNSAKVQSSVEIGKNLYVSLNIVNDGFAAPAKLRKLNLIMKNTATNAIYTLPFQSTAADARKWSSGSRTINETLTIPTDVPVGSYSLSLAMPDASSSLASNASYAIRFANTSTWDATTGSNNLNATITVTAATTVTTPTIVIDGSTTDWDSVDNIGLTDTTTSIQKLKVYDDAANLYVLASGTLATGYQLYIDADGKFFTGYQSNGADYKIEGGKLYRHEWSESWVEILTLNSSQLVKTANALEVSIPKTSLYGIDEYVGVGYRDLSGTTILGSLPTTGNLLTYNLINPLSVPRPAIAITVDGNSSDWAYLNSVASSTSSIQLMKVYDDIQNIYIMLKGSLTSTATDYDLFINTDNNAATGLIDNSAWGAMGADYAIIGGNLYKHDSTTANGVNGWGWIYQGLAVTTTFDATQTTQEIVIPKSKFNALVVGDIISVGYRKLDNNAVIAKLPYSGGMATYAIENAYIPNLQTLVMTDDINNLYATIQGASITANYKMFLNTDNNTATGYTDSQYWSAMGADYMVENGILYKYNGVSPGWGWTSASTTLTVVNTQLNASLAQRVITFSRAEFAILTAGSIIQVGFANDLVADKIPAISTQLQSYTFTKAYIPALSNFAISDNSTNIVLTVQGSSLTDTYEAFLDADNNSSTGFIDPTWSPMGADYMIQNGSLYSYSGTANAWGWTLVQSGLQVNNSTINTDLYQREILIQRSKLSTLAVGNTIKGGYRSVVNGVSSAVKPTAGGVMLSHVMTTTYVSDLQSIAVTDDTSNIIVTVTGGNLSTTYQVYLNSDNVAASGLIDGTWDSTGIEYLIENGLLYSYSGTGTNWSWTSISGSLTVVNSTVSGVTTRTITIPKVSLENLAGIIKVGYRNIVSGSLSGKLPADNSMFSFTLLPTLQQIGESGTLTFTQTSKDTWFTKTLLQTYNNPVVILSPVSFDNVDPATMRVKNVTNNSFEYQLDEWDYLDGVHPSSTIYYMVVEAGRYTLDGGVVMEAGVKQLNNKWSNVKFGSTFATVPLVLAQTMSCNAPTAVTSRIRYIETSNLEMKIQEEEANDYINNRVRTSETVGYVAITQGSGNFGFPFETDGTNRSYNNQFKSIWFNDDVSTKSSVFAHMQTSYSGNTAALRYKSLSTSKFSVKVEEEQSYDFETAHTDEEVGYLVLGGSGVFQGIATESNGTSTAKKAISTKQVVNTILDENFGLSFYPNPVDHFLNLESDNLIKQLSVFNINGQIIYTDQQQEKEKSISTESWTKGIYIVKALLDNGKTNIVKVVKR